MKSKKDRDFRSYLKQLNQLEGEETVPLFVKRIRASVKNEAEKIARAKGCDLQDVVESALVGMIEAEKRARR